MKNTMTDLVIGLKKLSQTPYMKILIGKAEAGEFHDYRSKAICGKQYAAQCILHVLLNDKQLVDEDKMALKIFREEIVNGDYDETLTDEDRVIMKEEMLNDPNVSEKDRKFFFAAMGID